MKKTLKKLLVLCMAVVMLAGMATTAFAAGGSTFTLVSRMGTFKDMITLSNVVNRGNTEYIDDKDLPTYLCNSPAEVVLTGSNATSFVIQKVTDEELERAKKGEQFLMTPVPVEGKAIIWDWMTEKELTIDYNDLGNYDLDGPPNILRGAKAAITEKGAYIIYADAAPSADYISAIVIVDSGKTVPTPAPTPAPTQPQQAAPTASNVLVNSKQVAFDAYNIGGNNYFKLRDLAYALKGSDKQFEVSWDKANNAILLISETAYTSVGGDMEGKGAGAKTALPTSSKMLLDGKEIVLTAYNIGGNNYFKLRDIGQAFDFGVKWDGAKNTIAIDTNTEYTE